MSRAPVDALQKRGKVGRTSGIAFRQCRKPVPLCVVEPGALDEAADLLFGAIRAIGDCRCCGAYLFADPRERLVYVISEDRAVAQVWIRERAGWLVGLYRGRVQHNDLLDDLVEHLRET